jgi:hypothetical protein
MKLFLILSAFLTMTQTASASCGYRFITSQVNSDRMYRTGIDAETKQKLLDLGWIEVTESEKPKATLSLTYTSPLISNSLVRTIIGRPNTKARVKIALDSGKEAALSASVSEWSSFPKGPCATGWGRQTEIAVRAAIHAKIVKYLSQFDCK